MKVFTQLETADRVAIQELILKKRELLCAPRTLAEQVPISLHDLACSNVFPAALLNTQKYFLTPSMENHLPVLLHENLWNECQNYDVQWE